MSGILKEENKLNRNDPSILIEKGITVETFNNKLNFTNNNKLAIFHTFQVPSNAGYPSTLEQMREIPMKPTRGNIRTQHPVYESLILL